MSKTVVWENDRHDISWRVTSTLGVVDLTDADVRLIVRSTKGGSHKDLAVQLAGNVVIHRLDGTLDPGEYQLVVEVTRGEDVVTYPDAANGPALLVVKRDIG